MSIVHDIHGTLTAAIIPAEWRTSTAGIGLGSQAKEDEIRDWLGPAGDIKGLRLNRDKATGGVRKSEKFNIWWLLTERFDADVDNWLVVSDIFFIFP